MRSYEPSVVCGGRLSKTTAILKWVQTMFRAFPASRTRKSIGPELPWVMRTPRESQMLSTGSPKSRQLLIVSLV